jgi:ribosomal protein L11 methyltransferase
VALEAPFELIDEGLAARPDESRPATVRGYVSAANAAAARAAVERATADLGHLQAFALRPIGELRTRLVNEEDWAEAWKEHFPVLRVGRRLVVRPSWREYEAADGEVVIDLDPGMAFGTGLHPTTRLCLAALEDLATDGRLAGMRVLDVGSGSGILAIAAAALGAASVMAIDTDPIAVEMTARNAQLNGLGGRVVARQGSVPLDATQPFDLVLANLVASLLVDLAAPLAGSVAAGGRLIASGIFQDRESEVVRALEGAGLPVLARRAETDWVALEAAKAA